MQWTEKTDEELMLLYQEGSEKAFQELYNRHSTKVFGYIVSKVQKHEVASEIFQEVFIKIHKSKPLYNHTLPLLPWLFTITRNTITDYLRRLQKMESSLPNEKLDEFSTNPTESSSTPDLAFLMQKLPPQQQRAMQLRYYDEQTFEEIANTLKTSPVNIRKLISRGLQRMKELLKEGGL